MDMQADTNMSPKNELTSKVIRGMIEESLGNSDKAIISAIEKQKPKQA